MREAQELRILKYSSHIRFGVCSLPVVFFIIDFKMTVFDAFFLSSNHLYDNYMYIYDKVILVSIKLLKMILWFINLQAILT